MKNGVIIQNFGSPAFSLKKIKGKYLGVSSFHTDPLLMIFDPECQKLQNEATWKRLDDEYSILLQFAPNLEVLYRYLIKCKELNIDIRLLYIESDYLDEVCDYDFDDIIVSIVSFLRLYKSGCSIVKNERFVAFLEFDLEFSFSSTA